MLKFEAGNISKEYACRTKRQEKWRIYNLHTLLIDMENELMTTEEFMVEEVINNMKNLKREIDSIESKKAEGSIFRCRARFQEYGEKSSKYFFSLEKHNFVNKTMYCVRKQDGTLTKDYSEILNEQHKFYKSLCTANNQVKFTLQNTHGAKLNEARKLEFELFVSKDELFDRMMTLKANKCPGLDSLSLAFYKKFWKILVDPLYEMLCQAYEEGDLSFSARRSIINLIPKQGCDETLVKSWRPIPLLNYDYHIFAKALSNQMDSVIDDLVDNFQTGFIKDALFVRISSQ